MNYEKHYTILINRAKNRTLDCHTETHHVVPRCMGGTDHSDNLVELLPEEHYIAHQLLVKIYPGNYQLVKAAAMMIPSRPSNKLYGWLKRKLSKAMSVAQTGESNSQYGLVWIHNKELKISKRIKKDDILPSGWNYGRVINFDKQPKKSRDDYRREINEKTKIQANELYNQFLLSDCKSVTEFAKLINSSQPRLTMLWKKYVAEYAEKSKHGITYKK